MPELVFTVAFMALRIFMLVAAIAVIAVLGVAVAILWMEGDGADEESSDDASPLAAVIAASWPRGSGTIPAYAVVSPDRNVPADLR